MSTAVSARARRAAAVLVAALALGVLASAPAVAAGPLRPASVERVSGPSAVHTAVAISRMSPGADTVVVAGLRDYADALVAAPFAASLDAPLLLAHRDGLHPVAAEEVARLRPSRAILVGGAGALSSRVETGLAAAGVQHVERIAGRNRFDTAARVAARMDGGAVLVVEGLDPDPAWGWPEAVAATGLAAHRRRPILLVTTEEIPLETRLALQTLGTQRAQIVGQPVSVSVEVEDDLRRSVEHVERFAGVTRYDTARVVAEHAVEVGADPARPWLATGKHWIDAVLAGAAAGARGELLLLVDGASVHGSPPTLDWINRHRPQLARLRLVGGGAAISAGVEHDLRHAATRTDRPYARFRVTARVLADRYSAGDPVEVELTRCNHDDEPYRLGYPSSSFTFNAAALDAEGAVVASGSESYATADYVERDWPPGECRQGTFTWHQNPGFVFNEREPSERVPPGVYRIRVQWEGREPDSYTQSYPPVVTEAFELE